MSNNPSRRQPVTPLRSIIHVLAGLSIAILTFVLPRGLTLVLAASGTFIFLLLDSLRLINPGMNRRFQLLFSPFMRKYETTRLTGASFLFISCLVCLTLFDKQIATLAISFVAVGDPLAHIVSERWGRIKLFGKTLEGALACFAVSLLAGVIWSSTYLDVPFVMVIIGVAGAALAESLTLKIDDNLTMPLFAALAMWLTLLVL